MLFEENCDAGVAKSIYLERFKDLILEWDTVAHALNEASVCFPKIFHELRAVKIEKDAPIKNSAFSEQRL